MQSSLNIELAASDWMLLAALGIGLYWAVLNRVRRSEILKRHNITTWGPVILVRFTGGLSLLDKLSRPKRFWRVCATAGVPLVIAGMFYFLVLLILLNYAMIRSPPEPSSYTAPRNVLLIPGINQFIPFVWGWIALFITLVVHEVSHGVLSRVEGIRVKSMGLVFAPIPIAAFVEPDEEELFGGEKKEAKAKRDARIRILAAGVIANFVVAALAMAIFFGPVIGAITPLDRVVVVDVQPGSAGDLAGFEEQMILEEVNGIAAFNLDILYTALQKTPSSNKVLKDGESLDLTLEGTPARGVLVASIFEGHPAEKSGMREGLIITEMNGVSISDLEKFREFMNSTTGGEELTVITNLGTYTLQTVSRPDGGGFMGVGISGNAVYIGGVTFQQFPATSFIAVLKDIPHSGFQGFFTLLGLPFTGVPGFTEGGFPGFSGWISGFFEPGGWAVPLGGKIFWIANFLLWVGWINLYAGLFNCLPAVPLDGGHIFRDLLLTGFERLFQNKENAERMARTIVSFMAWLILSSILFTMVAPYMAHGFTS
jgi:membrane-associated protease RseP (regulator of RpoE activity)